MKTADALGPIMRRRTRGEGRLAAAWQRGRVTLGFLGGSITSPRTGTRWPERLVELIHSHRPDLQVQVENAAVGATGSDWAVFQAARDMVARGCDLVFLDHAVNDHDHPSLRRMRTREGIVRQLLAADIDVVLVHLFRPEMLADMDAGLVPPSIADFELLAEHYGLSSVWAGLAALRSVRSGVMSWAEWLPDGLHPESSGSLLYADPVWRVWNDMIRTPISPRPRIIPGPWDAGCWAEVTLLEWGMIGWRGPWTVRRPTSCFGMREGMECNVAGAGLRGEFEGRAMVVAVGFGRASGELRWRIDEGPWRETARSRPEWAEDSGWYRPEILAEDLPRGRHRFEIETACAAPAEGGGAHTLIGFIGVVR